MRLLALMLVVLTAAIDAADLAVSADFPNGNAKVERIDQATRIVRIAPTVHKDRGWACWWHFRLDGITPGETITLEIGGDVWSQPRQAVYSLDQQTWTHTGPGKLEKKYMVYQQKINADHAWFAWGPVFHLPHAQALVDRLAKASPHAKTFNLCTSTEGRSVPALRVTQTDNPKRFGIWVHARQHAWESGSSWVGQGFAEWLVSDDPRAETLRKKALITIVPIMDVDNVERGAGGKGQKPNDHNRDWGDAPHWPEVRAAMALIKEQHAAGAFDIYVDLHNPGANDKHPYYYTSPRNEVSQRHWTNLQTFVSASKEEITGPLKFIGTTKESGAAYDKDWRKISKNWIMFNTSDHVIAVTLETPWNVPQSTQANYQQVGKELGLTLERYLREDPRGK